MMTNLLVFLLVLLLLLLLLLCEAYLLTVLGRGAVSLQK